MAQQKLEEPLQGDFGAVDMRSALTVAQQCISLPCSRHAPVPCFLNEAQSAVSRLVGEGWQSLHMGKCYRLCNTHKA